MKLQRRITRVPRTFPPASRPISDGANGSENGSHEDDTNAENVEALAQVESVNGADTIENVDTVQSSVESVESAPVTNGSSDSQPATNEAVEVEAVDVAPPTNGSQPDFDEAIEPTEVIEATPATNGSSSSPTVSTPPSPSGKTVPTLPKRRRNVVPAETEVVARPLPSLPPKRGSAKATSTPPTPVAAPTAPAVIAPRPAWRLLLTYENIFWLALFALAVFTRFWDLGPRGIHHDESLHAHFSDVLYIGNGYIHDPMMHGPLQFHLIAFMYWLFGATDATARFASVFCGIFVVMSPFFLRRQMGRVAAMVCAFLLLISPGILYFSRMAREDAIFSGMEMIMLVGLWRFVSTRKPADFIIFCAGLSLMFTIKETSFLTLAIIGVFFLALFAYQAGYAVLAALGGYLVAAGGFFMYVNGGMKAGTIAALPNIANPGPDTNIIMTFASKFLTHPLVYGEAMLFILFIVGVTLLMRNQRDSYAYEPIASTVPTRRRLRPAMATAGADGGNGSSIPSRAARPASTVSTPVPSNGQDATKLQATADITGDEIEADDIHATSDADAFEAQEVWDPTGLQPKPDTVLGRYQAGSIPHLLGALFSRPKIILIGFLVAFTIFFTLYTVFFTDIPHGIVSGLFASLGYWMGQHDVRRGDQPWFYYFLLIPLYEPVAVFFSLVGTIFFSLKGIRWLMRRRNGELARGEEPPRSLGLFNTDRPVPFSSFSSFLPLFLIVWLVGTVGIYSWAGEKMPWLMMHMTRPAIFLAALFIGALILSLVRRRQERLADAAAFAADDVVVSAPPIKASGSNGVPARRRTTAARAPQPVVITVQEPPWVGWNKPGSRFPLIFFLTTFVVLVMAWGLLMNALGFKAKFDPGRYGNYGDWGWTWVYPLLIIVMVGVYALWLGLGRSLRYLGLGILAVGLMYQFRSAINLAYNEPDVSTELASYVQTSPDVVRVMNEIETFSNFTTTGTNVKGGNEIKIMYDDTTSWPMEWYLRDYNKVFIGAGDPNPGADVPILLLDYERHKNKPNFLPNYIAQRYAMRWWFPQEWYMQQFLPTTKQGSPTEQVGEAIHTVSITVTEPKLQSTLWKYLIFRETPQPLGSTDMTLYLRRDIAQLYHRLQYDAPPSTDVP
ncbi:MAG TPA: glycosyltransferase family 39 protein [Chloroflexia bacterium]|nr:glycosyltransferase family 39 protein [Chloroflexia bacterium]